VAAQEQAAPLSELIPNLYLNAIIDELVAFLALRPGFVAEDALFEQAVERLRVASDVIKLAGNQLTSFPLASASGGFTWNFDTGSGAFSRTSNSFGPIFAERPLTIGRKRLNVGGNYQHVTFDHLQGRSLRGGEVVGYLSLPLSETDALYFADFLDAKVTTDTVNVFATYGITDRIDIGLAVPFNRVSLDATLTTRFGTLQRGLFEEEARVTPTSGTASGIGDVVVRAKFNILNRRTWAIAESVDVRLPTGDELELLGIAGPQVKLTFIASSTAGRLSPHANFSYTIPGTSSAGDRARAGDLDTWVIPPFEEINYAVGADMALSLRSTIAADVLGRTLRKAGTLTWAPGELGAQFSQFQTNPNQDLHLLLGSVGIKVNPWANMLLTTNVLFPLKQNGLTDNLTWMAGVDYSF
jgi:hypothetical protein